MTATHRSSRSTDLAAPPWQVSVAEVAMAIRDRTLAVHYQPIVDLHTYQVRGVEALSRWFVPGEGWRPPERWIPVIEESQLIVPFGHWLLDTVVADVRTLHAHGYGDLSVAVNVSPRQFDDVTFLPRLACRIAGDHLPRRALEFELTERHFRMSPERLAGVLASLHGLGCRIALDDYGTGDSSLHALFHLPVDTIKIDRSFVRELPGDATSAAIVDSTVMMAHRIGLSVIAEGVERVDQMDFLRQVGCDAAQGFLFGRAMPPHLLVDMLATWEHRRAEFTEHSVESSVAPWRSETAEHRPLEGIRILVVDDEPTVLAIADGVLTEAGAKVNATSSVGDAMAHVRQIGADVVLFDVRMPGLSGWDFMRLVRHEAPRIALVAVSGWVDERLRAIHRPDAIVLKPYRAEALVGVIRDVIASGR